MDEKECKSVLSLENLYFTDMKFCRSETIGKAVLNVHYHVRHEIDNDKAKVEIITTINSTGGAIDLSVKAVGNFSIADEAKILDAKSKEEILRLSTVTIMIPYIRSQVSIMTTQPDMNPIMLQPIDVVRLVSQQQE